VLNCKVSLDLFALTAPDQVSSKTLEMSFPVGCLPQKKLRCCSCQLSMVLYTVYTVGADQVPPVDRRGVDRVPFHDCGCKQESWTSCCCRFASLERHRTAHGYNITLQIFIGQATLHFWNLLTCPETKCERQASVRFANAQAAEAAKEACDAGQARSFLAPGRLLLL